MAGLTVFGLVIIADQASDNGIFEPTEEEPEETVYFTESFGTVGETAADHRTVELGDFTAGEGRGEVLGFQQERTTVNDRIFRGQSLNFEYNATQPRNGNITFEVLGRDTPGTVYVRVNGETVFNEHLIATSTPEVHIPEEHMRHGINRFEIGVNRDGFFSSSEYVLEDVELRVSDRKFHAHRDSFRIYGYEIEDHLSSDLNFRIGESIKEEPLQIHVNDEEVYSREQVRTEEEVEIDLEHLRTGSNSIRFSTDRPARYVLEDVDITMRYIGPVNTRRISTDFQMDADQRDYAHRDETSEHMRFQYRSLLPTTRPLEIRLNDDVRTVTPSNGLNRYEIPEGTLQEHNSLEIRSNGTYIMENFEIRSMVE